MALLELLVQLLVGSTHDEFGARWSMAGGHVFTFTARGYNTLPRVIT